MPIIAPDFENSMAKDVAEHDDVMQRQKDLLASRYDLSDNPSDVKMSGGRKAVQQGVRVKLPEGMTWDKLNGMSPEQIKSQNAFPMGFPPAASREAHDRRHGVSKTQIDAIAKAEARDLKRFDVDFDIPDHLTPEFPPPIFLSTHPELGDVSQGQVLTIKNYYSMMLGKLTPGANRRIAAVLTPFPQQQFNQTEDRKVATPQLGVTCLDCHVNGHTNATFHLNPDTRPASQSLSH